MKVKAVFDIGKTNKKFFLFDEEYREVFNENRRFDEIKDEDGDPCDDLAEIDKWVRGLFRKILEDKRYNLRSINFSSYGASFVHIDHKGRPVTPLYNYLKAFPADLLASFHEKYGDPLTFARQTASPPLGMLNSGLQLYWLKYVKPEWFDRVRWSLHLPQYLSYLFTGIPLSDYTSIGCHTGLWDYSSQDYHAWVYEEGIDRILPPIVETGTSINRTIGGRKISIGVGIHDSSSALLPYIQADKKPFLLISTGTWSISLNPFSSEALSKEDLENDCLQFLRVDGKPVKAARLFLGNEYRIQVEKLHAYYQKDYGYHRQMKFDQQIYARLMENYRPHFSFESIQVGREAPPRTALEAFGTFEEAFHQLLLELMELQVRSAERAIGNTAISRLYVDGGFADNQIYIRLLSKHFNSFKLRTTKTPLGSALGAAMVISEGKVGRQFLRKKYQLRKYHPPIRD